MHRRYLQTLIMIVFAAVLLAGSQSAFAQLRIVGSISGTVQDPTGGVVPNARVVLKDLKIGLTRESTTTEAGTFLFPDLASGSYQVTVSLAGFKTELVPNIAVSTSQTTDIRITLEVGQPTETVTISDNAAPVLETTSQLVVNTLEQKAITELPLGSQAKLRIRPPNGRTLDVNAIVWRSDRDGSAFFFIGVDGDDDVYAEHAPRPVPQPA